MAISYINVITGAQVGNGADIDTTSLTGASVGDLLIMHAGGRSNVTLDSAPSGWTILTSGNYASPSAMSGAIAYKIADSGDLNTTLSFAWSNNNTKDWAMWCFRNIHPTTPITLLSSATGGIGTTQTVSGITPVANSMLLLLSNLEKTGSGRMSGYAIATDNPTWTEVYDRGTSSSTSGAYALRTQSTATGNGTVTINSSEFWVLHLLAINPQPSTASNLPMMTHLQIAGGI